MSRLVDKLEQTADGGAPPIGFKSAVLPRQAPLLIIGEVSLPLEIKGLPQALDAVLFKPGNLAKEIDEIKRWAPEKAPWGVSLKTINEKALGQIKEALGDFVVLTPAETGAAVLMEEDLGKIVVADSSWPDVNFRSLEALPVDAILAEQMAGETSLTLQSLIELRRQSLLAGKPLIVKLSYFPPEKELSALLRVQARAIVIPVKTEKDASEAAKLHTTIENLPRTKPKKPSISPLIPTIKSAEIEEEPEEEE